MKKTLLFSMVAMMFFAVSCGGSAKDKVKLTPKGELITKTWKYDSDGALSGTTGDTTEILKKDVKTGVDFLTGTLRFVVDKNGELAYERKYGKGFLSISVLGYWKFNADESGFTMEEWDSKAKKRKPAVECKIIELTADKFIYEDSEGATQYYKLN